MIIGICGQAGSGKDTTADFLVKNHGFVKVALADPLKRIAKEVFSFSDEQLWGPSAKRDEPDFRYPRTKEAVGIVRALFDQPVCKRLDLGNHFLTPRYALQRLGAEWGRDCYSNIWVEYALRVAVGVLSGGWRYSAKHGLLESETWNNPHVVPAPAPKGVVISDVRYRNEIDAVRGRGGEVWRMMRGTGLEGEAACHLSETEQLGIPDSVFDRVLDNRDVFNEETGETEVFTLEKLEARVGEFMREVSLKEDQHGD